jgi:RNA polymerase sigma factor for flagellar operon FliA
MNAEAIFLENLPFIDKVASSVSRRYGLWGSDAEDFAAWVKIRMMENDFAVLRKHRGESDWRTFITAVVVRHGSAFSRERRGMWRPSAAAERLGPPATELEKLVRVDGYTVSEAGEKLRTAGRTTLTDGELARLLASLPERLPLRPVDVAAETALQTTTSKLRPDDRIVAAEDTARRQRVAEALKHAMDRLSVEDRAIALMYFVDGSTIAHVARALQLDQKPLYRRIPKLRDRLRAYLEAEGVSAAEARGVLETENL